MQAGDICFVGVNADGPDAVAFVLTQNVAAGAQLTLVNGIWSGAAGAFASDATSLQWTAQTSLAAGTVIVLSNLGSANPTANLGLVSAATHLDGTSATFDITPASTLFLIEGDPNSPATFITAIGLNPSGWNNTGDSDGLDGTGLSEADHTAFHLPTDWNVGLPQIAAFEGTHTVNDPSVANGQHIYDIAQWAYQQSFDVNPGQSADSVTPDLPFDPTAYTNASGPATNPDHAATNQFTPVVIDILSNDSDPNNTLDASSITDVSATQFGAQVVVNPDGTITYTPDVNSSGSDTFTYTVTDSAGFSQTNTVTVDVASVSPNSPPQAVAQETDHGWINTGAITMASTNAAGAPSNGFGAWEGSLSADGRYAFFSAAGDNLAPGSIQSWEIWRKDLVTGDIVKVGTTQSGAWQATRETYPSVSADGRFVAYVDENVSAVYRIYLKDMLTGASTEVSTTAAGIHANMSVPGAIYPVVAPDGSAVFFVAQSSNLYGPSVANIAEIYRKDIATGAVNLVSTNVHGDVANGNTDYQQISVSADGKKIAFISSATNLTADVISSPMRHAFVKDLTTGQVTLIDKTATGELGNSEASHVVLSADGTKVAFTTYGTNFGDANFGTVWLKDLATGHLTEVGLAYDGTPGNSPVGDVAVSSDGNLVAFFSAATNLMPGVAHPYATTHLYVKNMTTGDITLVDSTAAGVSGNGAASGGYYEHVQFSGDGAKIIFGSFAYNLYPQPGGQQEVYVKTIAPGAPHFQTVDTGDIVDLPSHPTLTANGLLLFTDADSANLHNVSYASIGTVYGQLTPSLVQDSTGGQTGHVTWTYAIDETLLATIAGTVQDKFDVLIDDGGYQGPLHEQVTITIHGTGSTPLPADDAYSVSADGYLSIDAAHGLLANDAESAGLGLSVSSVGAGSLGGTLTVNADGSLHYQGQPGVHGDDVFDVLIANSKGVTAHSQLVLHNVNDAPDVVDKVYNLQAGQTIGSASGADSLLAGDADINGDSLSLSGAPVISGAPQGAFSLIGNDFTYQAGSGAYSETYDILVDDGYGGQRVEHVTFNVTAPASGGNYTFPTGGGAYSYDPTHPVQTVAGGPGLDILNISLPTGQAAAATFKVSADGHHILADLNGDGTPDLTISGVEDIFLNGAHVVVIGDFSHTGLAPHTLHYTGTDGADLFDASGMVSTEDVVALGGLGDDTLIGGAGHDSLDGGAGADQMVGGLGDDAYVVDNAKDLVVEKTGEGFDTVHVSASHWTATAGSEIEKVVAADGTAPINLTGNAFAMELDGNAGLNRLDDSGGADTLVGGAGNDAYLVHNAATQVVEQAGEGYDTVFTDLSTYQLPDHVENLTYTGPAVAGQPGFYGVGNDTKGTITGGIGDDTLVSGTGAEVLKGGGGHDTFYVNNVLDVVVAEAGSDSVVYDAVDGYKAAANIAALYVTSATGVRAYANDGVMTLVGGTGNDTLVGGRGTTTLDGNGGSDTLICGPGSDIIRFSAPGLGVDRIVNFDAAHDRFELAGSAFGIASLADLDFVSGVHPTGADGHAALIYDTATRTLSFDPTGGDSHDAVHLAVFSAQTSLSLANFAVV